MYKSKFGGMKTRRPDTRTPALNTEDIAELIGKSPDSVRQMIRRGTLSFTGIAVKDYKMLMSYMIDKGLV